MTGFYMMGILLVSWSIYAKRKIMSKFLFRAKTQCLKKWLEDLKHLNNISQNRMTWKNLDPKFLLHWEWIKFVKLENYWLVAFNSTRFVPTFYTYRSSRSQMFFKIGALKNFTIFTGKHLCCSLFFINKVAGV